MRRTSSAARSSALPACRRRSWSACLPAARDELGDLLAALLADLFEVLVAVLLGHGVAADLADTSVELRPVEPPSRAGRPACRSARRSRSRGARRWCDRPSCRSARRTPARVAARWSRRPCGPPRPRSLRPCSLSQHPLLAFASPGIPRASRSRKRRAACRLGVQVPYRRSLGRSLYRPEEIRLSCGDRPAQRAYSISSVHRSGHPKAALVALERSSVRPAM